MRIVSILGIAAAALILQSTTASAQCLTKPAKIEASLNGKDAYALAKAEALKVGADSVTTKFTTLLDNPLDMQGKSTKWDLNFFSESAKKVVMISLEKGAMTCFSTARDSGGQTIEITNATMLDTKLLLDAAQAAGGSKFDPKTVTITAGLVQNRRDGTLWYLTYQSINPKKDVLLVILDGAGKVKQASVK